jgi:hypothetical protein
MQPRVSDNGSLKGDDTGSGVVLADIDVAKSHQRLKSSQRISLPRRQPDTPLSSRSYFPQRFTTEQIKLKYGANSTGGVARVQGVPIALMYGGSDTLLDMQFLLNGLSFRTPVGWRHDVQDARENGGQQGKVWHSVATPPRELSSPVVYLKAVNHYEHLCFLWADDVHQQVIPDVIEMLDRVSKWTD